jgi:hypothetical protein
VPPLTVVPPVYEFAADSIVPVPVLTSEPPVPEIAPHLGRLIAGTDQLVAPAIGAGACDRADREHVCRRLRLSREIDETAGIVGDGSVAGIAGAMKAAGHRW